MIPDRFTHRQTGADCLREGCYRLDRSRARRVDVPVRIWFGLPDDPETGEPLDRSPRWQIKIGFTMFDAEPIRVGGVPYTELSDLWPACAKRPIEQAEYDYMIARAEWASDYDPNDPHGYIGGKVDPMTCTLP